MTDYPCASEGSPASGICCDDRKNPPTLIDRINHRHGHGLIGYGAAGLRRHRPWSMRREMLSPHYTTRWDQLLHVTA